MPVTINGTTGIAGPDGSASTPAVQGTDSNTGLFFPAADTVAITTGGTQRVTVDSSGNVGIGTGSPGSKLDILSTTTAQAQFSYSASIYGRVGRLSSGNYEFSSYENGANLIFGTSTVNGSTTERARITSAGDFRVKGAGTAGSTDAFQVSGSAPADAARIDSSGNLLVGKTSASQTSLGWQVRTSDWATANTLSSSSDSITTSHIYSTGAGAYRFYVGMGGTVYATSTTITAISDQRLKENIQDIDVGLNAVMALKPRKFDWKEGKGKDKKGDRGWIAQEFEQVFPDMITTWKDEPPEGEEPYKAVNADLIPVLVKAIQELKADLDATKAELAALKGA